MRTRSPSTEVVLRAALVAARVIVALGGGYALSAAASALLALALTRWDVLERSEAVLLAAMLAFLIYLACVLWVVSARHLLRVSAVLTAATLLCYGLVTWQAPRGAPPSAAGAEVR